MIIQEHIPIGPYTTFQIGGVARYFTEVRSSDEIREAFQWAKSHRQPLWILAGGSNLVCGDGIIPGLCVRMRTSEIREEPPILSVDAGVSLSVLVDYCRDRGYGGFETLSGIPGSVGGAIVGNAGAYGHSIGERVRRVLVWDGGRERVLLPEECLFSYRDSAFKHPPARSWAILRSMLEYFPADPAYLQKEGARIIEARLKKYPAGLRCPGSFFKNVLVSSVGGESLARIDRSKIIEGKIPAGYLLEAVGACGMTEGGLVVASYHGNLIFNTGGASYADARALAGRLISLVRERFGIQLEEEVRYVV